MKKITLIKLGGSVITDKSKPYTLNKKSLTLLAQEIKNIKIPYILLHGSGSFGHTSASKYGAKHGYISKEGITKVCLDTMELHQIVIQELVKTGIPAISLRPMDMMTSVEGKINKTFFDPVLSVLSQDLVPVLCGDVIWDSAWKTTIFSGEYIISQLSKYLLKHEYHIEQIIQAGSTSGVFNTNEKTISTITLKTWNEYQSIVHESKYVDVTGGMKHKVESALELSKNNIKTSLINGTIDGELIRAIQNKPIHGTVITKD